MTRQIFHAGTLFYYDGIQIFEGRDRIGGHYVGTLVNGSAAEGQFAIVGVSPWHLQRFRLGYIDLRTLITARDESDWFLGSLEKGKQNELISFAELQHGKLPSAYLPEEGFHVSLAPTLSSVEVRKESVARNCLAMEIAIESLIPRDEHRVHMDALGGFLIHLQSLVKNAYRKSLALFGKIADEDREISHLLDVAVPAAPGSLKVILVPARSPGLFRESDVRRGLEVVDEILANTGSPEQTLLSVKKYAGHTAGAFVRFIRFMIDANLTVGYSWATPERESVSVRALSRQDAEALLLVLNATEKLTVEPVELKGKLKKVDMDARTWRLRSIDGRDFSGKSREDATLRNLVTDRLYLFQCEEESEEVTGTGREVRTLYLTAQPMELPDSEF